MILIFMMEVSINYVAVFVAAIVSMVIGGLWYSPILFGNIWMKAIGLDPNKVDQKKKMNEGMKIMGIHFVLMLIAMFVLAHFVKYIGATDAVSALLLGFWVWLGFILTTLYPAYAYEGRSLLACAILAAYNLVCFGLGSLILVLLG